MNIARWIAIFAAIVGSFAAIFLLSSLSFAPGWALGVDRAADAFELTDRSFRSDLLGARIGLLRNYDALNRATADQRLAMLSLQTFVGRDRSLDREIADLAAMVRQREAQTERFKSSNVLVYNSLARFVALNDASPESAGLSVEMLRLTLNTDPLVVHEAQAVIADLMRHPQSVASPCKHALSRQVIEHAKLLVRAIPDTDALLGQILAAPVHRKIEQIRRMVAEQKDREDIARRHIEIAAGVIIGAFFACMIATRLRLIMRARALRRKVEVEHIGSTVSALLFDAQSDDLPDRIERGLAALGVYMEVDCVFLVLTNDRDQGRVLSWSCAGTFPNDLASDLVDGACQEKWDENRLRVTKDHSTVSDAFALQIEKAGLRSLKLLRATDADPFGATLGCGSAASRLKDGSDVLLVCRMTLAVILQALRRDSLEKERSQLERDLQRARRMETIGAMATGVAHNFNNIMGAISGFAEIAALHVPAVSPVARNLDEISHAVDRARDLVDQILTFGRRPTEPPARLQIADLLTETGRMLRVLNPRVDVHVSIERGLGECSGLATQIQQIIMNIGQNAARAMNHAGAIRIVASYRSLSRSAELSHARLPAGRYAAIEIVDMGTGVDPAIMPHIFDPFFTTRKEGTGLGLSTAWEMIESHGGTIDVHSSPKGSRFTVWLPLVESLGQSGVERPSYTIGRGDRVLLIANDARCVDRDEELLAVLGYEPVSIIVRSWAFDLPALDMIDIVLLIETETDAGLGAAALAQVRAAIADQPILLATGIPARRHSRLPGVTPLRYPFRVPELATALSMAVQALANRAGSAHMPQDVAGPRLDTDAS